MILFSLMMIFIVVTTSYVVGFGIASKHYQLSVKITAS
jgi:hypothetical protein